MTLYFVCPVLQGCDNKWMNLSFAICADSSSDTPVRSASALLPTGRTGTNLFPGTVGTAIVPYGSQPHTRIPRDSTTRLGAYRWVEPWPEATPQAMQLCRSSMANQCRWRCSCSPLPASDGLFHTAIRPFCAAVGNGFGCLVISQRRSISSAPMRKHTVRLSTTRKVPCAAAC